jgi:small subunit ribosomal protein S17
MADEEKNEQSENNEEQAPEATEEQAPQAEAPAEEEAPEADGDAPAAEEPAAEPGDTDQDSASPDAAAGEADDALEGLDWKARMRLERSRRSREAGPERSPEERAAERAERRAKASRVRSSYRRKSREGHQGGQGTPPAERRSAGRKERQGTVVSSKADKTITVRIDVARRHPAYEKIVRQSSTLRAHDESNEAGEGDRVRIVETRPLSKTKRWRLVEVVEKAK